MRKPMHSRRGRAAITMIVTTALVIAGLASVPAAANAAATPDAGAKMPPGVTATTDNGHTVVSTHGVTISTVNGATIATAKGKIVASLSAAQTRDINALYLGINSTQHGFDANLAARAGASDQSIADAATVLAAGGWTISGAAKVATASTLTVSAAAACRGYNGSHGYYFPWGAQYGFNSCNTNKLIADVGLGAAGGGAILAGLALGGIITGGVASLIAAVIAVGVAGLRVCQANSSNGAIWLNVGGVVGVATMSCWGQ
jgi:hypothetical protein